MRPLILALCGLAALCHALPVAEEAAPVDKRQFSIGPPTVTICAGSCKPSSPIIWLPQPTVTSGFHVGRREEDKPKRDTIPKRDTTTPVVKRDQVDDIVTSCTALSSSLSPSSANSAYQLVIESCVLLFQKHDADLSLLGSWTSAGVSSKAKRQEIIIGACTADDIKALEAQYTAIVAQYGREDLPYDIAVLLESIKAALFYCALASPTTGPLVPDDIIIGDPVVPDQTIPGGDLNPDDPVDGGSVTPSD
jgi:hypothetical protein